MIILNVGYSRTTRKPHRKRRVEHHNVVGIRLRGYWNIDNGPDIRAALNAHPRKPKGDGWAVAGYAWVGGGDKANPIGSVAPDPERTK